MASLTTYKAGQKKGRHRVLFVDRENKRQAIYLPRMPKKTAEGVQRAITELERAAKFGHTPADFALAWVATASDDTHERLVKFGLAAPRAAKTASVVITLGGLVEAYQRRPGWQKLKPTTQKSSARAFRLLCQHIDPTTPIGEVKKTAARDFYDSLTLDRGKGGMGFAESTANIVASIVSTLFNFAIEGDLIEANPFVKLPRGTVRGNNVDVSLADSLKVLDEMRSTEDKLLFAMARWGGVRTVSEQRGLRWGDVDWERGRIMIRSPKTERHKGKATRWIPLFPEILPHLEARYHEAADGDEFILPKYCLADNSKATTTLISAIKRAGLEKWPRVWHSLRATRQSELAKEYPAHVVAAWLGNSMEVAQKHYLMVGDDQFEKATRKATQQVPATSGMTGKAVAFAQPQTPSFQVEAV